MLYRIAGHIVEIVCDAEKLRIILPNLLPFEMCEQTGLHGEVMIRLVVDNDLMRIPEAECHLIRDVDTGNGMTRVDRIQHVSGGCAKGSGVPSDTCYQFLIRDIIGNECGLLHANERFTECKVRVQGDLGTARFALNNALMLVFAFAAAYHDTLLIHASVVRHRVQCSGNKVKRSTEPENNYESLNINHESYRAYAFTAKSGTGKSTQVANWLRNIEGCDLVNDDNPIIRMVDGKAILYGSPWSGKTPCYRNIEVPLGAVLLIERDDHNHVEAMSPLQAFATLLTACSTMKWDEQLYEHICDVVIKFVENGLKMATLYCLPDANSAITCCEYVTAE